MAAVVQPSSHVGFDSITSQIERRLLKRGFQFNIMVVGQSGLGKTTFVNTLLLLTWPIHVAVLIPLKTFPELLISRLCRISLKKMVFA